MVNVIVIAHAVLQMHVIINRSKDIFLGNVLRDQIVQVALDQDLQLVNVSRALLQKPFQNRVIYLLRHAHFLRVNVYDGLQVHHHIGKDLDIAGAVLSVHPQVRSSGILDGIRDLAGDHRACLSDHLSRHRADHGLCQGLSLDTVLKHQLFIEFVTSYLGEVITPCVKKHAGDQAFRAVHRKRLARTDLLI